MASPPAPASDAVTDANIGQPSVHARSRIALVIGLIMLTLVACGFTALGIWQVERLGWKLALIARVDARIHAAPVAPPDAAHWAQVSAQRDEYRRVQMHGRFLDEQDTRVQAVTAKGGGWWVLTPFLRDNDEIVLVNRGWIAQTNTSPIPHDPATTVSGLVRISEPGGGFLRRNEPAAARWYSRDVAAIADASGLHDVAPYFVDSAANADGRDPQAPIGGLTVVSFRNHHLQYAMTWFALALMTLWACWRLLRIGRGLRHHAGHESSSPSD